jgi:Zn-finger nucleic acid-binding protein
MNCPKCLGKLEEIKIGEKETVVIDRCFACGGLWFDKDELSRVINKQVLDTVESEVESGTISDYSLLREVGLDKKEAMCPRCKGIKMIKRPSQRNKKVTIDYCEKCKGIWLDAGEYNVISKRSPVEGAAENIVDFFRLHFPHIFKDSR